MSEGRQADDSNETRMSRSPRRRLASQREEEAKKPGGIISAFLVVLCFPINGNAEYKDKKRISRISNYELRQKKEMRST